MGSRTLFQRHAELIEFYTKILLYVISFRIIAFELHALTIVDLFIWISQNQKLGYIFKAQARFRSKGDWFYDETTDWTKRKKNTQDFTKLHLDILLKELDIEPLFKVYARSSWNMKAFRAYLGCGHNLEASVLHESINKYFWSFQIQKSNFTPQLILWCSKKSSKKKQTYGSKFWTIVKVAEVIWNSVIAVTNGTFLSYQIL